MANVNSALAALADPTRFQVIERLRDGPKAVSEVAAGMAVSRPAVSQHLKVLQDSGLVVETWIGTRHYFAINPRSLGDVRARLDLLWSDALASFARHVEKDEDKTP